jgi:hypothetical protein
MSLEKFLGREVSVSGQPFVADRLDVAHLNVFITMCPVVRPDDAARPGFAPAGHRL